MVKLPLINKDKKCIGYISGDFAQKHSSSSKHSNIEHILVYEDKNHNPISNFLPFFMYDYDSFIEENIAPYNAKYIGIYDNTNIRIGEIDLKNLYIGDSPNRAYRVGLMSDIHYEVTDTDGDPDLTWEGRGSECYLDVKNAFKYYAGKTKADSKVDFIAAAGDISSDHLTHFKNFWLMSRAYGEGIPFFSCYGNHDYCAVTADDSEHTDSNFDLNGTDEKMTRIRHWNHLMFDERINKTDDTIFDIEHYDNNPNSLGYSTFLFKKALNKSNKNKYDVYIFLSVDYNSPGRTTAYKTIKYDPSITDTTEIPDSSLVTIDLLEIDGTKNGYNKHPDQTVLGGDGEWNIRIQFTGPEQRFYINYKNNNPFATNKVSIENIQVIDGNGTDVTKDLLSHSNPKVGFYGTDGIYHLDGVVNVSVVDDKLTFPCSSSFSYAEFPLIVYMNAHVINDNSQINHNKVYEYVYKNVYEKEDIDRDYSPRHEGYYDLQFYNPGALLWLVDKLETYKNKRVFIFTHQFFPHKSGTNSSYTGYKYTGEYNRITNGYAYCLCGIQFDLLNYLNNTYTNSIWFTGHSHYKWEWQLIDPDINISNKEYLFYNPANGDLLDSSVSDSLRYMRKTTNLEENIGDWWEGWKDSSMETNTTITCEISTEPGKEYHISVDVLAINDRSRTNNYNAKLGTTAGELFIKLSSDDKEDPLTVYEVPMQLHTYNPNRYKFDFIAKENITCIKLSINKNYPIRTFINSEESEIPVKTIVNWISMRINGIDKNALKYSINPKVNNMQYQYGSQLLQNVNFRIIDNNINTAYNVHLPSTSRPIPLDSTGYSIADEDAQGAIMDVYEDFVDIRGIIFKDNEIKKCKNKNADVIVTTDAMMFDSSETSRPTISKGSCYPIEITFTEAGQRCFISVSELDKSLNSSDTIVWNPNYIHSSGSPIVNININSLYLADNTGVISVDEVQGKIGFHISTTDGVHNLVLKQPVNNIANIEISEFHNSGKIAIECSKNATDLNFPITLGLKLEMNLTYTTNYINKYIPIGQYRIPIAAS